MKAIRAELLLRDYNKVRALIRSTPVEVLVERDETILHLAASMPDDGTTVRTVIDEGFGHLIMTPAAKHNDDTPLQIAVKRGNMYGVRAMLVPEVKHLVSSAVADECLVLAATYGQHYIIIDLVEHVRPSAFAAQQAVQVAVRERHASALFALFQHYPEAVVDAFHYVLEEVLCRQKNRAELVMFAMHVIDAHPKLLNELSPIKERTLLHIASAYKNNDALNVLRYLIDRGADMGLTDATSKTALQTTFERNNNETGLALMLKSPKAPIFWSSHARMPSLFCRVARTGSQCLVDAMIEGHPELRESHHMLELVMLNERLSIFTHLVNTHTDIVRSRCKAMGRTILMSAIYTNVKQEYIDVLLAHPKIEVDAVDRHGNTALHYAAQNGHVHTIAKLLDLEITSSLTKNVEGKLPVDCGPFMAPLVHRRMMLVSREVFRNSKDETIAFFVRNSPKDLIARLREPPTMQEVMRDAERAYRSRDRSVATARH